MPRLAPPSFAPVCIRICYTDCKCPRCLRLSWRPLAVATSLLSHADRSSVTETLVELGGHVLSEWAPAVQYLVMNSFKMSVKVSCGITEGCSG